MLAHLLEDLTPEELQAARRCGRRTVPRGGAPDQVAPAVTLRRHWRSYGTDPLPSPAEALRQPLAAFPSWFLRIECEFAATRW